MIDFTHSFTYNSNRITFRREGAAEADRVEELWTIRNRMITTMVIITAIIMEITEITVITIPVGITEATEITTRIKTSMARCS